MKHDMSTIIDELINLNKVYKLKVEPEGIQLQLSDEQSLLENEDFKKVIITASLLSMLTEDKDGSYWPLLEQLLDSVKGSTSKLIDLYEVTFNVGTNNKYHPMINLKEVKAN